MDQRVIVVAYPEATTALSRSSVTVGALDGSWKRSHSGRSVRRSWRREPERRAAAAPSVRENLCRAQVRAP